MKFSFAAVLAAAAGAYASKNVTYVTEVVTALTTYCPEPTQITYGDKTYTVTAATTLTISACPGGCTVTKPVTVISSVICNDDCDKPKPTWTPAKNSTVPVAPTGGAPVPTSKPITEVNGAGKAAVLSGAGLAGLLGLAVFVL